MVVVQFIDILPEAALMLEYGQWRQSHAGVGEDPTMLSLQEPEMEKTGRSVIFFF